MNNIKIEKNVNAMMALLLFGGFLSLFNETILNVALSNMMDELKVSATTIQWLSTGYVLVVAIMVPATAFLLRTYTTKELYVGAMSFFLIGTIFASISPVFSILLLCRMIQAIGTGLLVPIMVNTALCINPPEKHGFAMSLCTGAILIGPSFGPIVSGMVLQFFTWRALFVLLIPFVLICIVGGMLFLDAAMEITKTKIDLLSILLSAIGFACIVYGMSVIRTNTKLWLTILIFMIGIIALLLFGKRQLKLKEPMLDITAFQKPLFSVGAIIVITIQMVQFSMNVILPLLLGNGLGCSSFESAIVLFPAAVVCCIMTLISGKIYDKIGGNRIIPIGLVIMLIALFALSRIQSGISVMQIAILNICVFFGISLAWSPNQSNALKQLPAEKQAHGVAITNTFIQLGAALGTPLFVGLMDSGKSSYLKNLSSVNASNLQVEALYVGFRYAITAAVIIIAVTFLISLTLGLESKINAKKQASFVK
ncbi:DHA2 family efflux MFS transporter permease subunit [Clostridium beijerinckii]|uniref:DHA2 family efflux MFS transporter permease subunit n=1 Tax=Clostridium beijerinckii TaxID=1520 RepID=UPI00098C792E|nr:DHA2 family efflux MFS transporter permease subunit [Clostridium beijerinckii]MBA8933575.1 DHA2 family lincomycin resistance protein-like MFS transporter [Clostridium beijerinckii]NRU37774.1 DHA2 family lincomycin resistance protein-like MFS transporter [Clostridium beijerinckii]NSA98948.1 DHA2 family lincomycin resistance protein-like MFS transporter [Clostridium beijerinckii]OOM55628.1 multidrug export protein EmrB [Clostridium beijerinckii]OOM72533.1 multidrug export protein EmrB [Clostr